MDKFEILHLLGWCSLIYLLFLLLWVLLFTLCHNWLYEVHGRMFPMSVEKFNYVHYQLLGIFKIIWMMFFLIPYLVLRAGWFRNVDVIQRHYFFFNICNAQKYN